MNKGFKVLLVALALILASCGGVKVGDISTIVSGNGVEVSISADFNGEYYILVKKEGEAEPSVDDVLASSVKGSLVASLKVRKQVAVTESGKYIAYVVVKNTDTNKTSKVKKSDSIEVTLDSEAPVLSDLASADIEYNAFNITGSVDEDCSAYVQAVLKDSPAVTEEVLENLTPQSISAGNIALNVSGLGASISYDVYILVKDAVGNTDIFSVKNVTTVAFDGPDVKISRIFNNDGDWDDEHKKGRKYIELYNAGTQAENLTGWSIQTNGNKGFLKHLKALTITSGQIEPKGYFLIAPVELIPGDNVVVDYVIDELKYMSNNGYSVALVNDNEKVTGADDENIVDQVGVKKTKEVLFKEGQVIEVTESPNAKRKFQGENIVDTNNNATDFEQITSNNYTPPRNKVGNVPYIKVSGGAFNPNFAVEGSEGASFPLHCNVVVANDTVASVVYSCEALNISDGAMTYDEDNGVYKASVALTTEQLANVIDYSFSITATCATDTNVSDTESGVIFSVRAASAIPEGVFVDDINIVFNDTAATTILLDFEDTSQPFNNPAGWEVFAPNASTVYTAVSLYSGTTPSQQSGGSNNMLIGITSPVSGAGKGKNYIQTPNDGPFINVPDGATSATITAKLFDNNNTVKVRLWANMNDATKPKNKNNSYSSNSADWQDINLTATWEGSASGMKLSVRLYKEQ